MKLFKLSLVLLLAVGLVACGTTGGDSGSGGDSGAASGGEMTTGGDMAGDSGGDMSGVGEVPDEMPGFAVRTSADGETWLFYSPSQELSAFDAGEKMSDKHVTRINYQMGDKRVTTKAPDAEIFKAYEASKPGFVARYFGKDPVRRLWVFKEGAAELDTMIEGGELAKHVSKIGGGMTIRFPDNETRDAYMGK